jgi:uncharacterized membrane protein YphA (DoxX/SURF4 family)
MTPFLKKYGFDYYLLLMRIWFASLLIYHGFAMSDRDTVYVVFHWIFGDVFSPVTINNLARVIEWVCALPLVAGLYTRFFSGVIGFIMLFAIVLFFIFHAIELDGGALALTRYFFWFSIIFIFFGAGAWSADRYLSEKTGFIS